MISICIITKNEKEYLVECLKHLKKYQCEIVIIDTGSTDGSVKISEKYADKVGSFEWCSDFSKARNYAASQASNDIIFMLDTDEYVEQMDVAAIEKKLTENPYIIGKINIISPYTIGDDTLTATEKISRIYDRRYFAYRQPIHEQLVSIGNHDYSVWDTGTNVNHVGYLVSDSRKEEKARRNLNLLLKEHENNPDDTYIIYQVGKCYMWMGDNRNAVDYFEKTFSYELEPHNSWVINMLVNYGYLLISLNRKNDALSLEGLWDDFADVADFSFMMGYIYMMNMMFDQAINAYEKATTQKIASVDGIRSYLAYYNIGVIYECLGNREAAISSYKKCGNYDKAIAGIERLG